jgi:hypothetical protein
MRDGGDITARLGQILDVSGTVQAVRSYEIGFISALLDSTTDYVVDECRKTQSYHCMTFRTLLSAQPCQARHNCVFVLSTNYMELGEAPR